MMLIDKFSNIIYGKVNGEWVERFRDLDLNLVTPDSDHFNFH